MSSIHDEDGMMWVDEDEIRWAIGPEPEGDGWYYYLKDHHEEGNPELMSGVMDSRQEAEQMCLDLVEEILKGRGT